MQAGEGREIAAARRALARWGLGLGGSTGVSTGTGLSVAWEPRYDVLNGQFVSRLWPESGPAASSGGACARGAASTAVNN
ncbi:hypothetical protein HK405_012862 [Cladochytrium tenue]|nr:hypothetical protein HK405_012862 [Cladochytrium tenue]